MSVGKKSSEARIATLIALAEIAELDCLDQVSKDPALLAAFVSRESSSGKIRPGMSFFTAEDLWEQEGIKLIKSAKHLQFLRTGRRIYEVEDDLRATVSAALVDRVRDARNPGYYSMNLLPSIYLILGVILTLILPES